MAILSFGLTSYKFAYPIIGGIVYAYFPEHPYSCSPLFKLILMDFGMLLSFIFEAIPYVVNRGKDQRKLL